MVRVFGRRHGWARPYRRPHDRRGDFLTATHRLPDACSSCRQPTERSRAFSTRAVIAPRPSLLEESGHCKAAVDLPVPQLVVPTSTAGWSASRTGPRMYPDGFPDGVTTASYRSASQVAWDKLVFACLSRRAPSFREWIAPVVERYDRYRFETLHARSPASSTQTYPINWKAFVENSNDDYHVRFVHRRLNDQRRCTRHDRAVRRAHVPAATSRTRSTYDISGGRTRPRGVGAPRPLRRLHLPQPHAAALPDAC